MVEGNVETTAGKLYLIPTPIGNLEDITLRALRLLKEVDLILAEDTRKTARLLQHYQIENQLRSYHIFNEHKTLNNVVDQLRSGVNIGLVSDAGTPSVSDPGFLLTRAAIEAEVTVECLPGACALIVALVNSGLPTDRFVFEGFLPKKKGRQTRLTSLSEEGRTMIFFESPFRIAKTLADLSEHLGADRQASVARELTKMYQENVRGTLGELCARFTAQKTKGEIVLCVTGKKK